MEWTFELVVETLPRSEENHDYDAFFSSDRETPQRVN